LPPAWTGGEPFAALSAVGRRRNTLRRVRSAGLAQGARGGERRGGGRGRTGVGPQVRAKSSMGRRSGGEARGRGAGLSAGSLREPPRRISCARAAGCRAEAPPHLVGRQAGGRCGRCAVERAHSARALSPAPPPRADGPTGPGSLRQVFIRRRWCPLRSVRERPAAVVGGVGLGSTGVGDGPCAGCCESGRQSRAGARALGARRTAAWSICRRFFSGARPDFLRQETGAKGGGCL
jgi:hypothetical protein